MKSFKSKRSRSLLRRRGAAAVEAALVLPVLVILTLGTIDMSQYIASSQCVTNACREGARFASKAKTSTCGEVENVVEEYLASTYPKYAETISSIVTVYVRDADGETLCGSDLENVESGDGLEVEVKFNFSSVRWLPGPKYAANNEYRTQTFCRRE